MPHLSTAKIKKTEVSNLYKYKLKNALHSSALHSSIPSYIIYHPFFVLKY